MTNEKPSTIRPGLLVSLKTSVAGNVAYFKEDVENAHITEEGKQKAKWTTERVISDPAEFLAASQIKCKAGALIRRVCAWSDFGLLCPQNKRDELDKAIAEARVMAKEFNDKATLTRVRIRVMIGEVAANDAEALQSINSEVRDLMAQMQQGIASVDVKAIRDAAQKAKQLGSMLEPGASAMLQQAIEAARNAARKIVKAGEASGQEIDREAIKFISGARTAFLDMDEADEVQAPVVQGKVLDIDMEEAPEEKPNGASAQIDLEELIAQGKVVTPSEVLAELGDSPTAQTESSKPKPAKKAAAKGKAKGKVKAKVAKKPVKAKAKHRVAA